MEGHIPPKNDLARGEIRHNIISNTWVVVAAGRSKRPHDNSKTQTYTPEKTPRYKESCPFCNLTTYPQAPDTLRLPNDPDTWQVHIFPNKYPAFTPKKEFRTWQTGPYSAIEAVGYHEILAPRYHNQGEHVMTAKEISTEFEALTMRYRQLKTEPSVNYIQVIKNHGAAAGASIEHPHHQIFTTPTLPNDVASQLHHAETYFTKHGLDPFTATYQFEQQEKTRVIMENDHVIAFCPYASRVPYEVWIMPKAPDPYFEDMGPAERAHVTQALQEILRRIHKGLQDPPYNYYIHSAPCDDTGFTCNLAAFQHYRWHIEILPRLSIFAGFELGTGMEINTTLPEEAAAFLREAL